MRYVDADDGVRIAVEEYGAGQEAVVLSHQLPR